MSVDFDKSDPTFVRSVLAASDDCIKVLGLDGSLTFMSEGGMRVMEVSDFNAIRGCPWPDFWQGAEHETARAAVAAAREGRSAQFIGIASTMKGNPRWWDVRVTPILDADGRPNSILSVSRDITELKLAEQRNKLLAQEMSHRTKNTLAMVQAIVTQTLKPGETIEGARETLVERLSALGRAHDILTQSSWTTASLTKIVEGVLDAHGDRARFRLAGPEIELASAQALLIALAVNELAVNATKYGALSTGQGHVDIAWAGSDGDAFSFTWAERGGPVVAAPGRSGFGSSMLRRAVASGFGGEATLDFAPDGLVFALTGHRAAVADA